MNPEDNQFLVGFYHENHSKLFIHAYAILQQQDLAEIATQEAYRIACQKIDKLRESENPIGWMKKTVEHVCLHILREQRRNQALILSLEELPNGREPIDPSKSDFELRERCWKVLSKEEFDFFLHITEHGYGFLEESKRLGISLGACYKRFERLRIKLQKILIDDNNFKNKLSKKIP